MSFCWHKWSKWSDPVQTYSMGTKQQWKVCEHCNKVAFRNLRWDKITNLSDILAAIKSVKSTGETK